MRRHGVATAVLGTVVAGIGIFGCRTRATVDHPRPLLRVGTAFGPLSEPLTAEYQRRLPNLDIRSQRAADSDAVIAGIENGTVDLGIAFAEAAYLAYWGSDNRAESPQSPLRSVSLLQPLPQYLLVAANSGIRRVADLRGRRVLVGPRGSSSGMLGPLVMQAFGVAPRSIRHVGSRAEAAEGLKNGTVDAIFLPGFVYPDEATLSAIKAGAYMIPIDGPDIDRLRRDHPFVRVAMIPRDIYPGQNSIIPTVGVDMVVLCRRDLDPAVVRELTAQLFSAYPQLSGVEATLRFLNPDEAPATPIPLHPGAARYFRERELAR